MRVGTVLVTTKQQTLRFTQHFLFPCGKAESGGCGAEVFEGGCWMVVVVAVVLAGNVWWEKALLVQGGCWEEGERLIWWMW